MALHLIEGLDLWEQELGEADLILVCGSYNFNKKNAGLTAGYGAEAVSRFPNFAPDLQNHMKLMRKPPKGIAPHIYGLVLPGMRITDYNTGTLLGVYQIKHLSGDVDLNLLKHSINMIKNIASNHDRIAIEYPAKKPHGGDEDAIYPILARVPENCVFYYPAPPLPAVDYAAIGQSYAMGIKYNRPNNPKDFHRR